MDITAKLATGGTEYLHVPLYARRIGTPVTPTGVKMAILAGASSPAAEDWVDAEYIDGHVRILVGPVGGAITLAPGDYYVWATCTAGIETPVKQAPGRLRVY